VLKLSPKHQYPTKVKAKEDRKTQSDEEDEKNGMRRNPIRKQKDRGF
jgi:hypothetical protein